VKEEADNAISVNVHFPVLNMSLEATSAKHIRGLN
jgi:hypothetical protein